MKLVVDTSISPRIARALNAVFAPAHKVVHANDVSGKNNADAKVCEYLQANTPSVFLIQDQDIIGQPHRMAALGEMKCHLVILAPGWLDSAPDQHAWMLLKIMPRVFKRLEETSRTTTLQLTAGPQPHIRKLK